MTPTLTQFGDRMFQLSGVRAIMKDIIETLRADKGRDFINLSAGNPVILPEVEQLWRDCTAELLASNEYGEVVCRYGASQGYGPLINAIVDDFNQRYGLVGTERELSDRNILITPGSQSLYFLAANAFGGYISDTGTDTGTGTGTGTGTQAGLKKTVLPLSPDYTGYGGVALRPESLMAYRPTLDIDVTNHRFKYQPDFDQLTIDDQTGLVIFSRPCNPTGNVVSDQDTHQIVDLAAQHGVPVFIDSAYAPPFPALNFTEMQPIFAANVVHCMSLSKAGLPGERIGIAIGDPSVIQVLEAFQTNLCIHSSRYGQAIAARAIRSGALAQMSHDVIRPHYQSKLAVLEQTLDEVMPSDIPWFLHRGEGAIFAWLWLKDLPSTDWDVYQALKAVDVIVVPGHSFFPGLQGEWAHTRQCFRISLTATKAEIAIAMKRLAQVVEQVYR